MGNVAALTKSTNVRPHGRPEIENITPEQAERYLKAAERNRPLSSTSVVDLAIQMESNNWVLNGETIKFDDEGRLIDGQHRLEACILSGKPFRTYVIRGIHDRRAFSTIDVGRARTPGDIFALSGFVEQNTASAAASILYYFQRGMLSIKGPRGRDSSRYRKMVRGTRFTNMGAPNRIPKEELLEFAAPIKDRIIDSVKMVRGTRVAKLLQMSVAVAAHVLFADKNRYEADKFFADLGEGAGLATHDPVYHLRERLIANKGSAMRLTKWAVLLLVLKTWNKRRAGEKTYRLQLSDNEEFPKVR